MIEVVEAAEPPLRKTARVNLNLKAPKITTITRNLRQMRLEVHLEAKNETIGVKTKHLGRKACPNGKMLSPKSIHWKLGLNKRLHQRVFIITSTKAPKTKKLKLKLSQSRIE